MLRAVLRHTCKFLVTTIRLERWESLPSPPLWIVTAASNRTTEAALVALKLGHERSVASVWPPGSAHSSLDIPAQNSD